MKKHLRLLPLILILSLLIGVIPLVALAAEATSSGEVVANILEGKTFTAADRATAIHAGSYNGEPMNYDYTKLTDNDMHMHTGRFSTKSSDSTQVFDGIVDLGGGYTLGELLIYDFNPTASATPFMGTGLEIQTLWNGEWTTVISCASNDEILAYRVGSTYLSFDLSGTKAEKIRIYIPSRLGTNSISIYEIKCSGALESIADVFEGKVFEAGDRATPFFVGTHSGVSVNYDYTKLTDNNTHYQTGRFSTKSSDTRQVFDGIIDLGGGYFLDELKINDFNSTATTAPFMGTALEIQVYSLGKWTTVVSCASNEEIVQHRLDSTYLAFNLGGVRAEKVRIYIPERLGTNSISINEIECSATIDHTVYNYFTNLLLGKTFVPTEAAGNEVHVDPTCDYGYAVITDDSYLPKGGRFSTTTLSKTQHVDATVNLDGTYQLDELRIYDFNAHAEPNASTPGYLGPNLTIEAYVNGEWSTVLYCTKEEYGSHRVSPSNAWGAQYLSFDLTGVTAEMLKIYIPSNIEGNSISFYEITCSGNKIAEHTLHTAAEAVRENNVLPTCTEKGSYDNVVCCMICGVEMSRDSVSVPALGHSYNAVVTAPTCTDAGYITYTCTVCGDSYTADETAALGHTGGEAVTENNLQPDCINTGKYDTVIYCTVCGTEVSRETVTVAALAHSYDAAVTAPDCTNGGYTTYTCSVCGDSYVTDETDALGHTMGEIVQENVIAPDCVNEGRMDEVTYCTVCGVETSRITYTILARGHNGGTATCYNPKACDDCGEFYGEALGHSFTDYIHDANATCVEDGTKTAYCDHYCGSFDTVPDVGSAYGHDYADATTEAPKTCKICGNTEGDKLPDPNDDTTEDVIPDPAPEKDHSECEATDIFTSILNMIINFIRSLLGLPEKCICGEELI